MATYSMFSLTTKRPSRIRIQNKLASRIRIRTSDLRIHGYHCAQCYFLCTVLCPNFKDYGTPSVRSNIFQTKYGTNKDDFTYIMQCGILPSRRSELNFLLSLVRVEDFPLSLVKVEYLLHKINLLRKRNSDWIFQKLSGFKAVFRIRDILVRIRSRGSVPLTNGSGSGSCSFRQ